MKNSKLLLSALAGLGLYSASAQELSVDAMIRPRFEYRHGFQNIVSENTEGSAFVSQRSSLLLKYSDAKITTFLDLQSTNIWGDRAQLEFTADDSFRVNQGWAQILLGKGWATKVGRMQLSYDDQRILGGLGWADQQRTHDALLFKYVKSSFKMDIGFSFNQNTAGNFDNIFTPNGAAIPIFQYKGMQYGHLSNKFNDSFSGSFLFLNNQFQDTDIDGNFVGGTTSRQTTGVFAKYNEGDFGLDGSFYYQFGGIIINGIESDVKGYIAALNLTYKPGATLFGIGAEILSGNDTSTSDQEAFFPLFGTNHKFNGFQDFFYVGRHANNGGLLDINAKAVIKTGEKSKILLKGHIFSGLEDAGFNGLTYEEGYYGTSIDIVYTQGITKYANVKFGYSQSFFDDDFADARAGGTAADIQNWGWIMLTVKPNLFKWKKDPEAK